MDMWALGVICYILLGGYPPFHDENQRQLFIKIKNVEYEFHPEYWGHVSADAKDLIASMLTKGMYIPVMCYRLLFFSLVSSHAHSYVSTHILSHRSHADQGL